MAGDTKTRTLSTGENVHVVEHADGAWRIDRYEWVTEHGATAVMFAEVLGWNRVDFHSADEALYFADTEITRGNAPGTRSSSTPTAPR